MAAVRLALMWHQHQPLYTDPVTGQPALPWVRLHAIKDYWGMARLLQLVPEMRATINLVPSLLEQLEAYVSGQSADPHLAIGRKPTEDLSEAEAIFMLDNFFSANWDTMVRPLPRYRELLDKRATDRQSAEAALKRFGKQDLRDLSILYDLVWFHPLLREEDEALRDLYARGGQFTEKDRALLHERETAAIADVIPMHRKLSEAGALELTTTPYYHPILPLMLDYSSIHEALPDAPVPMNAMSLEDDARRQVADAIASHEKRFGEKPRGMWPSEGSVSQKVAQMLAQSGIEWIATDEQVLERSLATSVGRNDGTLARPDLLYRPYELESVDPTIRLVFRDHFLSDLIGFQYRSWNPKAAASDLLDRLREVGRSWQGSEPPLVPVILDGENAWEHYPNQGIEFLKALYEGAASDPESLQPVRVGDASHDSNPGKLSRVFAGSWIDHNFYIWGGHAEDRAAWSMVYDCRAALDAKQIEPDSDARKELRIAQGSDWYWWYGDDHFCANDAEFDRLFLSHIRAAYEHAGIRAPAEVETPIKRRERKRPYVEPGGIVSANIDGIVTHYFEWIAAGRTEDGDALGVMDLPRSSAIKLLAFGCDLENLYIRADFRAGARAAAEDGNLRIGIIAPTDATFSVALKPGTSQLVNEGTKERVGSAALAKILEVALPWSAFSVEPGQRVEFCVQRIENDRVVERSPREGVIQLDMPTEDDVLWDWSV